MSEISSNSTDSTAVKYTLDGREITLIELNEAKNKPGVKIVESSPGVYKTLQRLNG